MGAPQNSSRVIIYKHLLNTIVATAEPGPENFFLAHHIRIMRESLLYWCGQDLVDPCFTEPAAAEYLYRAPFALLSHDDRSDPVFNYANLTGQKLFAANWFEITRMHSRDSVDPDNQPARDRLLREVSTRGFIDDYQGVRIAKNGRRFRIANAIVWNLIRPDGNVYGLAAKFDQWAYLDETNS
jgi:MEKHLA domain